MNRNSSPPKLPLRFFRWYCHPDYREDIEGDLRERFDRKAEEKGISAAKCRFFMDVLLLFRPGLIRSISGNQKFNSYLMYKYHLKFAWRSLSRNVGFSSINILGLTLGLACCILIFSFVKYHFSFDDFHSDSDRIYRFVTEEHIENIFYTPAVPNPFGKIVKEEITYAEKVGRVCTQERRLIEGNNGNKYQETIAFAEIEYFEIMNFPMIQGIVETALHEPNSVILTQSLAKKYFGDIDPISKTLKLNNKILLKVTGILKDIPGNSDFQTQIYISYSTLGQYSEWLANEESWGGVTTAMQCFTRLKAGINASIVEESISGYPERFRHGQVNRHVYRLQPLKDIHLSTLYGGVLSKKSLIALMIIGVFFTCNGLLQFYKFSYRVSTQALQGSRYQ